MTRRSRTVAALGFGLGLALAVAAYAFTGSLLLALGWWAGPVGLAVVSLLVLRDMSAETRGFQRQEDERVARHRHARRRSAHLGT